MLRVGLAAIHNRCAKCPQRLAYAAYVKSTTEFISSIVQVLRGNAVDLVGTPVTNYLFITEQNITGTSISNGI